MTFDLTYHPFDATTKQTDHNTTVKERVDGCLSMLHANEIGKLNAAILSAKEGKPYFLATAVAVASSSPSFTCHAVPEYWFGELGR